MFRLMHPYQPVDEVFPGRSRHGLILWCPGLKGGSLMAMGQQKDRQGDLMVSWSEMPRSPGHVFYDRLQLVLIEGGFDGFSPRRSASPITRPGWGRLRCHPGATSVCTWWATSRVSTLSVGWSGAARIPCRYGSSCCWRCGNGCRTIPGCHGGIVKLTECRLLSAFLHGAKPLKLHKAAIDNLPRFRSESG